MKALIQNINVTDRVRKDVMKIDELAADIQLNGLINPITVMAIGDDEYRLLAGLRRLRAFESMGLVEIEVNVVSPIDAEAQLRIEIGENEQREPFTFSEKMNFGKLLEEIEKAKAQERMLRGKRIDNPVDDRPQGCGRVRDIVGSKIGMSGRQYGRAKQIADNATDEIIEQLDKGERSINKTYEELCSKEKVKKASVNEDISNNTELEKPGKLPSDEDEIKTDNLATETKSKGKNTKTIKVPDTSSSSIPPQMAALLSKEDIAAIKRINKFNAMSPSEKINELKRQLQEERVRATRAESELSRLKELRHNEIYHKDGIIKNLESRLESAIARVEELEAQYCPSDVVQEETYQNIVKF